VIYLPVRVEEVIRRSRSTGTGCALDLRVDESPSSMIVRVSGADAALIEEALVAGRRFVLSLRIAPPTLDTLASRDAADGAA